MIALNNSCVDFMEAGNLTSVTSLTNVSSIFPGTSSSVVFSRSRSLSTEAGMALAKLKSFRRLQPNWDSYGAVSPSSKAIDSASSFVRQLDRWNLTVFFTTPGPDGQILIEMKNKNHSVEFVFTESPLIEYAIFEQDKCIGEGEMGTGDFAKLLSLLRM